MQNNLIERKKKQINKILSVLHKSYIGNPGYDSTEQPFFYSDLKSSKFKKYNNQIHNEIPDSLNRNIKLIYELLGHNDIEIYIGDWTIMSINKAIDIYKDYYNNNRKDVFDIGFTYHGLGYIKIISCDLNNHLLFYRISGGSNGYDREINYKKIIEKGSEPYEKFYFSKWFYNI